MSYQGRFTTTNPPKKHRALKVILIILCVLVVLGVAGFYLGNKFLDDKLSKLHQAEFSEEENPDYDKVYGNIEDDEDIAVTTESAETTEATEPPETEATEPDWGKTGKIVNILLIGQDARAGESAKLADSIMLATINKEKSTVTLTSFQRDTYIKMPDYKGHTCGKNRINVNYALGYAWGGEAGAMEMLNLCIKNNFGVEIDGDIEVDFNIFCDIVESFGGTDVELDADEAAYMNRYNSYDWYDRNFEPGQAHLNGFETLHYVRMRHSSHSDNDFKRTARQRVVLGQMMEKASKAKLSDLNTLIDYYLGKVLTNISAEDMKNYILELLPLLPNLKMETQMIPVEGSAHGEIREIEGVESGVLIPDIEWNKRVLMEICEE